MWWGVTTTNYSACRWGLASALIAAGDHDRQQAALTTKGQADMTTPPSDADARRAIAPVISYPPDTLPAPDLALYRNAAASAGKIDEVLVPALAAALR